jgi:hypothetical protein
MTNIENVRQCYLVGRFAGTTVSVGNLTEKKIKSVHNRLIKSLIKKNEDFNTIIKFLSEKILFDYSTVSIQVRNLTFIVITKEGKPEENLSLYMSYSISSGEVEINEVDGGRYITIGRRFIEFQKKLYHRKSSLLQQV